MLILVVYLVQNHFFIHIYGWFLWFLAESIQENIENI